MRIISTALIIMSMFTNQASANPRSKSIDVVAILTATLIYVDFNCSEIEGNEAEMRRYMIVSQVTVSDINKPEVKALTEYKINQLKKDPNSCAKIQEKFGPAGTTLPNLIRKRGS